MQEVRFDFGFPKNSKIKVILHVYYLLDIIFLIWISKILPLWLSFIDLWAFNIFCILFLFQKCLFHILPSTLALTFHSLSSDFQEWQKKKSNLKIYFHAHKNIPCKFYLFVFFRKFRNDFLLWLLLLVMIVRYHS